MRRVTAINPGIFFNGEFLPPISWQEAVAGAVQVHTEMNDLKWGDYHSLITVLYEDDIDITWAVSDKLNPKIGQCAQDVSQD